MTAAAGNGPQQGTGLVEFAVIRHGATPGNGQRRYVGVQDQPLSEEGRAQAREKAPSIAAALPDVGRVYVSTLRRTHETAAILFPGAEQVQVAGVQEMDFGAFTGRSADEMEDDPDYRAWVEGDCEGTCPGGESKSEFTDRVCASVEHLLREACGRGEKRVVLVAHGGTMMSSFSRFSDDPRSYYAWHVGNCEGYRARAVISGDGIAFRDVSKLA